MKKKSLMVMALAMVMTLGMTMVSSASTVHLLGWWAENENGKWWQDALDCISNDGDYLHDTWEWIDGDRDGIAECYYMDSNGYLMTNTTTPDGCTVDENGAWTVDGVVQTEVLNNLAYDASYILTAVPVMDASNAVKSASGAKITANSFFTDRKDYDTPFVSSDFQNVTFVGTSVFGQNIYSGEYNGIPITINTKTTTGTETYGYFQGPAKVFFDGIPESGMEIFAFLESYGFMDRYAISNNITLDVTVNSGGADDGTGYPRANCHISRTAKYNYYNTRYNAIYQGYYDIILTPGSDGHYYVFPDTVGWM